ncbi:uncharacterized protein LOC130256654 [Oenanthe melanoleuca]|uniref:uncharacterized protein LOC130256654 n=1 Tax=Oenanthe melanoleuca TaxID=2939378 RepID=UPI0024C19AA7|nr:uncharacterized protein LOC130256654 [Oenanthe melanoleuca]
MTLLHAAQPCDRAAMTMWKTIISSSRTVEAVLQILLDVLADWPEHSTCTSDGDRTDVFSLAATVVMWEILQVPCQSHIVVMYFPHLFVHLLFQVFFSTLDMPEEIKILWNGCQEEHGLATSPNRFAVRTLKSLLCFLQYGDVVMAMDCKHGWDTLLCVDTHHYAVGLLPGEMRHASIGLCSSIALHLLQVLSTQELCWDLPAMALLVKVLKCLGPRECGGSVVKISSRYLQSKCRERHCLVFRTLLKLIDDPSMDDPQVQLLSIRLFQDMMEYFMEERAKLLENPVHQSILPLFFHYPDKNPHVAEASWETLLCAAKFLKKRDLKNLVKEEKLWKLAECLLAEDRSRAAEHLRQALPYLQSPQEPLREAAVRFTGEPGLPPRPGSFCHPGPTPWSPGCPRGCCRPPAAVPWGASMRQGPG